MNESSSAGPPAGLSADNIRDWARAAREALIRSRVEIDALNVFPVPDGDTGTNLCLTMEAACAELDNSAVHPKTAGEAASVLARGALLGARGNSGVILSQILRGMGITLVGASDRGAHAVARAFRAGADEAYRSVARPVEGTILTVARAAADAAENLVKSIPGEPDVARVVGAAAEGARAALLRTPAMLEVLRQAGVVDAGGRGLVEVYDALFRVLSGESIEDFDMSESPMNVVPQPIAMPSDTPDFEVMYLLEAPDDRIDALRAALDARGDSVVIVGGDGLWNVHVHADDAGACIEDGLAAGRPHRIQVNSLHARPTSRSNRQLVMVTHGSGITDLVTVAGVNCVPAQPRTRPSVTEILSAVHASHSPEVVLLPSDRDNQGTAEIAAEQLRATGVRVAIVPTRSVVQSLAAIAVHDPERTFDDDLVTMTRAAGATRYGAVTIAERAALTSAGQCAVGDVLGLLDGDIVQIGHAVLEVARGVCDRLVAGGGELITIVSGVDADPTEVEMLIAWLESSNPGLDVVHHDGGQPLWPIIVGVE